MRRKREEGKSGNDEREPVLPGGHLERALLSALWVRSEATARELYDDVEGGRGIVYTTVAKVLDRLVDKGMVERRRFERRYRYRARVRQEETRRAMARGLIEQLADGGPRPAVAALVGALEDVSPDLLDELAAELAARRRRRDGA
jgi:predicted transcriptional regulator